MTDTSASPDWSDLWKPWMSAALAPQKLWQSINSGWSFGNVTINEQNSSAPQTEQAILAQESYGRQIGKLMDAVGELVKAQPDREKPAYVELEALRKRIDALKKEAAVGRIVQLRHDLDMLRLTDREAFDAHMAALRALIAKAEKPD